MSQLHSPTDFPLLVRHHPPFFFFFNDTATTEIYTLSLHDALPISLPRPGAGRRPVVLGGAGRAHAALADRKSTRLNSSHLVISYAVFCLKKKKKNHPYRFCECGIYGPGSRQLLTFVVSSDMFRHVV